MSAGVVLQLVKTMPAMPASHMGNGSIPVVLLPIQLPANALGKQQKMAQCLGPSTLRTQDLEEALFSWLWFGTALVILVIWGAG